MGRQGAGPGELTDANGMPAAPDGAVWVNGASNAGINVYSGGKFLRQISRDIGGFGYRWDGRFDVRNGELVERPIGGGKEPVW